MNKIKFRKREIFSVCAVILALFTLFFLAGCDGGFVCPLTPITPCDGLTYACHADGCNTVCAWSGNHGTCDQGCGAIPESHNVIPGKGVKGGCLFGQVVNENCFCEWVDMDLDGYSREGSGYGDETDCNDLNSNIYPGADEICNNLDDDCDGNVDEENLCKVDVFVCKTDNFDTVSKNCIDGMWSSGSTITNLLTTTYHTTSDDLGENSFYTYVCDAYLGDGDYGCYYYVWGMFNVSRTVICNSNNLIDVGEVCDGLALPSRFDCEYFGYSGGLLKCYPGICAFDFTNCVGGADFEYCNNDGEINLDTEVCDGEDLDYFSCAHFGLTGTGLGCNNCRFDFSGCECSDWMGSCASETSLLTRLCPSGSNIVLEQTPCFQSFNCVLGDDSDGDGYYWRNCWISELSVSSESVGLDCVDDNPYIHPGAEEVCDGGIDNNCDQSADVGCVCDVDAIMVCGTNEGICKKGIQECVGGIWGACGGAGYHGPVNEICENSFDDNCDGFVNEGCFCTEGDVQECGSDVGICQKGNMTCFNNAWSICEGEISPFTEVCDDGLDNDCDTYTDYDDSSCETPDSTGGGGTVVIEKAADCPDGKITKKCKCGDKVYTKGYCYSGKHSRSSMIRTSSQSSTLGEELPGYEEEKSNFWLWFFIILILMGLIVFVAVMVKKKKVKLTFISKYLGKIPFFKKMFDRAPKDVTANELAGYFDKSLKKGKNRQALIGEALKTGWKKKDIEDALKEVDSRHRKVNSLVNYIKKAFGKKKVKEDVLGAGLGKGDFNFAFKKAKKK